MDQTNFCLIFSNKNNSNLVKNILFSKGIISYDVEKPENFFDFYNNKKVDFLFLDFDFANKSSFDLMDKLKAENEKHSNLYVIATSFNNNERFLKKMQTYNLISFVTKPLMPDIINKKIDLILDKFKNHFPKRQHIRVKPSDDELMRLIIKLKNNKCLTAKIIDISLGGLAAILYSDYNNPELSPGNLIEHITFEANHKEIDVDAKVINKKETFLALRFTHFYYDSHKELTKYIMKKLSV